MEGLTRLFRRLWADESAEVAIEYGLLVALVALALIAVFTTFSDEVNTFFGKITNRIADCPDGTCE